MSTRIVAVAALEAPGCTLLLADSRTPPGNTSASTPQPTTAETDAMHAILMAPADALEGGTEGVPEEMELKAISDALNAYEAICWP